MQCQTHKHRQIDRPRARVLHGQSGYASKRHRQIRRQRLDPARQTQHAHKQMYHRDKRTDAREMQNRDARIHFKSAAHTPTAQLCFDARQCRDGGARSASGVRARCCKCRPLRATLTHTDTRDMTRSSSSSVELQLRFR